MRKVVFKIDALGTDRPENAEHRFQINAPGADRPEKAENRFQN